MTEPGEQSDPLDTWLAEARTDEAARSRSRRRWLARQATESATLPGVLNDLARTGEAVIVVTASGTEHRADVAAVGQDVVVLDQQGRRVLVAMSAVSLVRVGPGGPTPTGDRPPVPGTTMLAALERLVEEGEEVTIRLAGDRMVRGSLEGVGVDVLTVRTGPSAGALAYVPLDAVLEVEVEGSG